MPPVRQAGERVAQRELLEGPVGFFQRARGFGQAGEQARVRDDAGDLARDRLSERQLIAEGEYLAALGEIILTDENGKDADFSYCDIWRFENGRMAELNAFVIALH